MMAIYQRSLLTQTPASAYDIQRLVRPGRRRPPSPRSCSPAHHAVQRGRVRRAPLQLAAAARGGGTRHGQAANMDAVDADGAEEEEDWGTEGAAGLEDSAGVEEEWDEGAVMDEGLTLASASSPEELPSQRVRGTARLEVQRQPGRLRAGAGPKQRLVDPTLSSGSTEHGSERGSSSSDESEWEDECCVCGEGGELLCCEGQACRRTCHVLCAGLQVAPEGDWFCPQCRSRHR
jgi:hypothetical protein